jgi:predicted glycosyltransferase
VDLAHKCSYENAIALIAPYSKELEDRYTTSETKAKTLYTGMFSRFDNLAKSDLTENLYKSVKKKDILVLSGSGSDDLDLDYLFYTARLNFEYNWHIVGSKKNYTNTATNFNNYGVVDNIAEHLNSADLIVSSAGHNLVSEIASFRKPMLLIPAVRPFDEQKIKAKILKKFNLALYSEKFPKAAAWSKIFKQASELELNKWSKHFNADAISQATNFIIDLAYKCQVVDGEEVKVDYQEYLKIINS